MNYLVILNSAHDHHFDEVNKLINDYDASIRVNTSTWLVNTAYDTNIIRQHLANIISFHDSLLVFKIDHQHCFINNLDLSDWLEDMQSNELIAMS